MSQSLKSDCKPNSAKEDRIIKAANGVFLRYGYARTTMGDIAEGARISRPALYLVFPRKDDIFATVIARMSTEKLQEMRDALPALPGLEQKLRFCCESWGAHGYDLTEAHPDASDLFDLDFVPVQEMYAAFEAFLAALLAEPLSTSLLKCTPPELAHNMIFAMRGFRAIAQDGKDMRRMIALHVEVILAALQAR